MDTYTQTHRHTGKLSHTQTDMILTQTHIHTDVSEAHRAANSVELQPLQSLPSRNPRVLPHLLPQVAPPNPGTAQWRLLLLRGSQYPVDEVIGQKDLD